MTAIDNIIAWNDRGGDFVLVAQIEQTTPLTLLARAPVHTIGALAGSRIAVDAPDSGFAIPLRAILKRQGVLFEDATWLLLGGVRERYEALIAARCDATLLGPPFDLAAKAAGFVPLIEIQQVWSDFPGQGVVASRKALRDKSTIFETYLSTIARAASWARENPDQAEAILVQSSPSQEMARAMLRAMPNDLVPSQSGVDRLIETRSELGLLAPGTLKYGDLVDRTIVARLAGTNRRE
ncbi:ABC transporter substrate-binding protein [Bradyrhizobium sp. I1.14.4]|uniref:ABC transporter substrate-binding protein n=1 Tax=unclassified Bradyrhizobium TaxID=2631580 RepID=UPI003D1C7ACA